MKNNASLIYSFFLVVGDFLAIVTAFIAAYALRVFVDTRPLIERVPGKTYLYIFLLVLPFWLIIFALLGLYNKNIYERRFSELGRLFIGSFVGLLFVLGIAYFSKRTIFPARLVPVYAFVFAFSLLLLFRTFARLLKTLLFSYNIGINRVLIVGDTPMSTELVATLEDTRTSGYKVLGVVGAKHHNKRIPSFADFGEAIEHFKKGGIHSIIQTELYPDAETNSEILEYAQSRHIAYRFAPGNSELFVSNIDVELFRSIPFIAVHQTALVGWGRIAKRLFDVIMALLLIIISSPVLLIITFLQLFSGGQIFFRQTRLTRFNHEFRVLKFRTVRPDVNGLSPEEAFTKMNQPELIKTYRDNGDQLPNDPRYGRLGNFLRHTSLDELPQLFNVLKGDISLVGPRALVPEELSLYEKRHAILSVKSGLTGLAQVSGRRHISFDERRKLDMYYVQNWTFWMDIVILIKTIRVVLSGEGAK